MIFKEKGYDEFVAEKIRQAELSMAQGKGINKAQMQKKCRTYFQSWKKSKTISRNLFH